MCEGVLDIAQMIVKKVRVKVKWELHQAVVPSSSVACSLCANGVNFSGPRGIIVLYNAVFPSPVCSRAICMFN